MGRFGSVKTSKYWLGRAEECRALADSFVNKTARDRMCRLAKIYEREAMHAAGRELAAMVDTKPKVGAE
jgi:hypothetical protein